MKVSIDVRAFRDAFGLVAPVAPRRSNKPILENVLFQAGTGGSTLVATDLEVGIVRPVLGVDCEVPGPVVLPRDRFASILTTSRDERLSLETDADPRLGSVLVVRGLHGQFKLPLEDPNLFPIVPGLDGKAGYLEVDARDLWKAILRTVFATDPESTRYALGGTLWSYHPREGLTVVGTDGRRLAQQHLGAVATGEPVIPASPVVPAKALKVLLKLLASEDPGMSARIGFPKGGVLVECGGSSVYARLVEGRFPRYQDVFPDAFATRVDLVAGALGGVLAQAAIATSDESRGVDFSFGPAGLVLEGKAPDVGTSRVELAVAWPTDAPPLVIAFDPRYMVDHLKSLDPDAVLAAEFGDTKSAAVFRSDDGYAFVLMPLTRDR